MKENQENSEYDSFKIKYGVILEYAIGSVVECSELYKNWNKKYRVFSAIYIPFYILIVYTESFWNTVLNRNMLVEYFKSLLPFGRERYEILLVMSDQIATWYVVSIAMLVPSFVLISVLYVSLYSYYWKNNYISTTINFKRIIGSITYILLFSIIYYLILFYPIPIDGKVSVPLAKFLFGPVFPVLASGVSVILPMTTIPFLAAVIRIFVKKSDR